MPTYAYACTACEHRFEAQQAFTDDALTECPQCQGRLRKLFNSVGIVFKGSGFYRTDSRANGNGTAAKDGPAAPAESSSKASSDSSAASSTSGSSEGGSSGGSASTGSSGSGSGSGSGGSGAAKPATTGSSTSAA